MRLGRLLYQYTCATAGERLYLHLRTEFIDSDAWQDVRESLSATGRSLEFIDLFQQIAAVNLAGRLVVAGNSFADRHPVGDLQFQQVFTDFVRETIGESGERANRVYRLAEQAVIAARRGPTTGQLNRFERWAERNHPLCYMCRAELDFTRQDPRATYTCEHVWPRMYGGDSTEENFLPACADCNSRIKSDLAGWAQVNVQALILGVSPSAGSLRAVNNVYNFALHYRVAQRYAAANRRTLKQAFLEIGPWTDIRVLTQHDTADFFNLGNHDPQVQIE